MNCVIQPSALPRLHFSVAVMEESCAVTATASPVMVALTVISRRIEDLDTFIERLEATGTFRGVLSRSDETLEDGTIESNLQGYYRHAANPAPAASEPKSAFAAGAAVEGGR